MAGQGGLRQYNVYAIRSVSNGLKQSLIHLIFKVRAHFNINQPFFSVNVYMCQNNSTSMCERRQAEAEDPLTERRLSPSLC